MRTSQLYVTAIPPKKGLLRIKSFIIHICDFTNDVCNNRNTVAFEKWDLVLSQNKCFFFSVIALK